MKLQIRSVVFALVLPMAACGGDRDKTVDFRMTDYVALAPVDAGVVEVPMTPVAMTQPMLVDTTKPLPTKLDELVSEGKKLAADGKYGDAKIMFDAAVKLDKKNVTVHVEMARMFISMNEKGNAVAAANQAVKYGPLSSQAWNTKGRAELTANNYDNAVAAFSKAVELDQSNVFAWNNLGYTELLLKQYDDAVAHLMEATSRPGATGYMFNNLGTALEHVDKLDDARTAYDAGGKLGSVAAASSRKRLEGVDSVTSYSVANEDSPPDESSTESLVESSQSPGDGSDESPPSDTATH